MKHLVFVAIFVLPLCNNATAQVTPGQRRRLLYVDVRNFLRYRERVFAPCLACKGTGTDASARPGPGNSIVHQRIPCDACNGISRLISPTAFEKLIECFAEDAAPKVSLAEYRRAWSRGIHGLTPGRSSIMALGSIARELRAVRGHASLKLKESSFEVRGDGVLLGWTPTTVDDKPIQWAWMKVSKKGQRERYRWLVVSPTDIDRWALRLSRIKEEPLARLTEIRALLFNPKFGAKALANFEEGRKALSKFSRKWKDLLHLREYSELETTLEPRKLQIEFGPDPVIEEAAAAFEKEARKRARRDAKRLGKEAPPSEGTRLANDLAYHQRARPARIERAKKDLARLDDLVAERPHLARTSLERIGSRDLRVRKSAEYAKWEKRVEAAIVVFEKAKAAARAKAEAERTAKALVDLAATLMDDKPDEARSLLADALEVDPKFTGAYRLRMRSLFEHTRYDDALADAERVLELASGDQEAALVAAFVSTLGGRADLGQQKLELIKKAPDGKLGGLYELIRALIAEASGNQAEALAAARRARTAVEKGASFDLERLITDIKVRNTTKSQLESKEIGRRAWDRLEELGPIGAATWALENRRYDEAIELASMEKRRRLEALVIRGRAKLFSGEAKNLAGAKEDLGAALRLLRTDPHALLYRGIAHQRAGETSRAAADYQAAAKAYTARRGLDELSIQTEARVRLSALYVELGTWDEVLTMATAAAKAHGGDLAPACFNRGVAHFHNSMFEAAVRDFDRATRIAFPAVRAGEPENYNRTMIRPYPEVVSIFPRHATESEYLAVAFFQRGCAYFEAKKLRPALQDFKSSKMRDEARFGAYYEPWWHAKEAELDEKDLRKYAEFRTLLYRFEEQAAAEAPAFFGGR